MEVFGWLLVGGKISATEEGLIGWLIDWLLLGRFYYYD